MGPAWIGMDTAIAFLPWYSFLGEQLRAGHIPTWNPHQFAGAPFAADPESGWMYLPAMLAFSLPPLDAALRAHLIFHVLLAALGTYALARALGIGVLGGLLASTIYAHSGFFEGHNVCCFAYADVAAWLPAMLLCAELSMQATTWRDRMLWCGASGLALSQILAVWVGQGAYYALLVLVSYVVARSLRTKSHVINLVGIGAFGFALGAAGLLPRLEYNLVSNLPGGYPEADVWLRATTWSDWGVISGWDRLLLQPGFEYIGWLSLALAVVAPLVAWRRPGVVYFAGLGLAVLVLARAEPTPLHAAFSVLPGFEQIHARSPERALIVFYLAPALLAGATLSWITSRWRWPTVGRVFGVLLVAATARDLHAAWTEQAAESLAGGGDYQFQRVDLATYFAPSGGARFLNERAAEAPFRYFGYVGHVFGGPMPYTLRWADASISALQVNNRGLMTGLDDIQGYNPIHVARYDEFVSAINGHSQNYHHADVFDTGLDSPLMDLLNVRYIIVPAVIAPDEVAPRFSRPLHEAYSDDTVRILENRSALPRAWIVHAAEQIALADSVQGQRDLRTVALLEVAPPPLREPAAIAQESVDIESREADRLVLRASATAAGMVISSEVYYPAWHAYLDGQPAQVYVIDRALRGVTITPGQHTIEMRYESLALQVGLTISIVAAALLVGLAILVCATRSGDGSGEVRCKAGAVPQL